MTSRGRRGAAVAVALTLLTLVAPSAASAKSLEPWWYTGLGVPTAHEQSTGKGVRIAVIDGAINPDIPEFEGARLKLRGAVDNKKLGLQRAKPSTALYAGHGTSMTALIIGQGKGNAPGGAGITGMAPDAEVYFYQMDPDPSDITTSHPGALFRQAIKDKVDIISYSFANTESLEPEIEQAWKAGIVVVVAAGNPDAAVSRPANMPGVVATGVLDKKIRPWKRQPEGYLTIVAPGVDIASGIMEGSPQQARWISGEERTGTSNTAPLVAGALALVKSKYPEATGNQLIQQLIHSTGGRDYGWSEPGGFGVFSLEEMLARDPAGWPDENPLLKGPDYAYTTYPLSAWKDPKNAPTPAAADPTPSPDTSTAAAQTKDDSSSSSPLPWVVGGLALLALLVVATLLIVRRRSTASPTLTGTGGTIDGTQ